MELSSQKQTAGTGTPESQGQYCETSRRGHCPFKAVCLANKVLQGTS